LLLPFTRIFDKEVGLGAIRVGLFGIYMISHEEIAKLEFQAMVSRARYHTTKAIKSGTLVRPDRCDKCDIPCRPDGHHTDYLQPLNIEWLCKKCHNLINAQKRKEKLPPKTEKTPKPVRVKKEYTLICPVCSSIRPTNRSHPYRSKDSDGRTITLCFSCFMEGRHKQETISAKTAIKKRENKSESIAYLKTALYHNARDRNDKHRWKKFV